MKTSMSFVSEKARTFLLTHGEVYTFRKYQRKHVGESWLRAGYGMPKITDIFVTEITCLSPYELNPYIPKSGFTNLHEWLLEIKALNNRRLPDQGYLYHVKLIQRKLF